MVRALVLTFVIAILCSDASASRSYRADTCRVAAAEKRLGRRGLARRRARANYATPDVAAAATIEQPEIFAPNSPVILEANDAAPEFMPASEIETWSPAAALFSAP